MSGFHYAREAGADGQIVTGEGDASGVTLDVLSQRERPSLRAALEIASAMADILCIAELDGVVHGDIRPSHVKIEPSGRVAVDGWGLARRTTAIFSSRLCVLAIVLLPKNEPRAVTQHALYFF